MWGGTIGRNMVSDEKGVTFDFDLREKKNVLWSAQLGSQTDYHEYETLALLAQR